MSPAAWQAVLPGSQVQLSFVPARVETHAELIHDWMKRPHVVPWWRLDRSLGEIRDYLSALTLLRPWVVAADGVPFGYVETYRAVDDPLAAYYPALDGDLGWHVLVGPVAMLGTGVPRLLGRAVLAYLLNRGERAICEPDVRNTRMLAFCRRLGHEQLGEIDLPEKRAALMVCSRERFDARWPGDRAAPEAISGPSWSP